MLILIFTLLAVVIGLVVLFWVGTQWAQGYFYDSTVEGLHWRAPAAAGVVAAFFALWCLIEYFNPGATNAIHNFSHQQVRDHDRFISVRKTPEREEEIVFTRRRGTGGAAVFVDAQDKRWSRSSSGAMIAIIIEEGEGEKMKRRYFAADLDEQGRFRSEKSGDVEVMGVRYRERDGSAYILEANPGQVIQSRTGLLFGNIVLNVLHFVLWWLAIWLLLRFQWSHALGFAFVCWLALTLALVPFLLSRSRTAAEKRGKPAAMYLRINRPSIA